MKNFKRSKLLHFFTCLLLLCGMILPLFAGAVTAKAEASYVYDNAGILSSGEVSWLNDEAAEVSEEYGCGVYMVTVDNYSNYTDGTLADFTEEYYTEQGFDENAVVLTLSMAGRDYDILAHGDIANSAFTDYEKEEMADDFLDDFADDNWYFGFSDYIDSCDSALFLNDGRTYNGSEDYSEDYSGYEDDGIGFFGILFRFILIPFAIAGLATLILRGKMKSVRPAHNANQYTVGDMNFTRRKEIYTHTTETRARIEHEDHGGTSVNSGGFSHSGGKF